MDTATEIRRLQQGQHLAIIQEPRGTPFVHVYSSQDYRDGFHCSPFFIPSSRIDAFLADLGWEIRDGDLNPHVERWSDGRGDERVFYTRDGNERGYQAFIIHRSFSNYWPSSTEICEEFRLFHNLYHHRERDTYFHCDVDGVEHEVVRVTKENVKVSLRFLSQFLQAKQMALALQYEGNYWSKSSLSELGLTAGSHEGRNATAYWQLSFFENTRVPDARGVSLLSGKAVIPCPGPIKWIDPYHEEPGSFQTFIIGHDDHGEPVEDTCDYEQIRNDYSRAMAAVYFRRSVLAKYYDDPRRYEVTASGLWCGSNWHLDMDHDGRRYVTVFLKNLSRLPAAERNHWKAYNVLPDGPISQSSFTRNIRGWWAESEMPDINFKPLYRRVNEAWEAQYGWRLWFEPKEGDSHLLRQVHVCFEDGQAEFDQQNAIMAKLLCDFLNESALTGQLGKSILGKANQLKAYMEKEGFHDAHDRLGPFFAFQTLRSTGVAHPKGDSYQKALKRAGFEGVPLAEASFQLFEDAVAALVWISECLEAKKAETVPPPSD